MVNNQLEVHATGKTEVPLGFTIQLVHAVEWENVMEAAIEPEKEDDKTPDAKSLQDVPERIKRAVISRGASAKFTSSLWLLMILGI